MQKTVLKLFILLALAGILDFPLQAQPPAKAEISAEAQKELDSAFELFEKNTSDSMTAALPKFKKAAELFQKAGQKDKQADASVLAGRVSYFLNLKKETLWFYNQALQLYRQLKNKEMEAIVLNNLALISKSSGESKKALAYFNEGLKAARMVKDRSTEALILSNLGDFYSTAGDKLKALEYLNKALEIVLVAGDPKTQAAVLTGTGKVFAELGRMEEAAALYNKSLEISRESGNIGQVITNLSNLGVLYLSMAENEKAFGYFKQSLELVELMPDKNQKMLIYNNIGRYYDTIGEKLKALDYFRKVLTLAGETGDREFEGYAANNIGLIYYALGENKESLKYFGRALEVAALMGDANLRTRVLNNIGMAHFEVGEPDKAAEYFNQALTSAKAADDLPMTVLILNNAGLVYLTLNQPQTAVQIYSQLMPFFEKLRDPANLAKALNNLGRAYEMLGEKTKAVGLYNQSVTVARAVGDRGQEAVALNNLMVAWTESKNPPVAAFFGKQAVNVFQGLRHNIKDLDPVLQKTYLRKIQETYRALTQILIGAGRIAEAEEVLAMLKEEEVFEYLRRDDKVAKELLGKLPLTPSEQEAFRRYDELADSLTKLGKEFGDLQAASLRYEAGKFPEQARLVELEKLLAAANKVFNAFLDELKVKFGENDKRVAAAESGTQALLKELNQPRTVVISTIAGEDRLNLIVTTADAQRAHTVELKAEDLNTLVFEFRAAVKNPSVDPRPVGKKLYDILFPAPLQKDLESIKADTIIWSLDGTLRYLPVSALWDGQKYLAERYAHAVITLASRDKLNTPATDRTKWTVLGVGVSKPFENFSALPAVPEELCSIVNDPQNKSYCAALLPDKTGVLPGVMLPDEKFTLSDFKAHLGRYPIIHISSHFSLNAGNEADSYLLLGGGTERRWTLAAVRESGARFAGVELLTLSACNTAMTAGPKSNGLEIEGFGTTAQKQGAKAVLATLWAVADPSTRDLMAEFYRILETAGQTGKAEALRQAQLRLMYGRYSAVEAAKIRSDLVYLDDEKGQLPEFKKDPNAPYSHPYYWSPFVLIGNWK